MLHVVFQMPLCYIPCYPRASKFVMIGGGFLDPPDVGGARAAEPPAAGGLSRGVPAAVAGIDEANLLGIVLHTQRGENRSQNEK